MVIAGNLKSAAGLLGDPIVMTTGLAVEVMTSCQTTKAAAIIDNEKVIVQKIL